MAAQNAPNKIIISTIEGEQFRDVMVQIINDEELARIAYICNKPIISAVGHEVDFTISDFVISFYSEIITVNGVSCVEHLVPAALRGCIKKGRDEGHGI